MIHVRYFGFWRGIDSVEGGPTWLDGNVLETRESITSESTITSSELYADADRVGRQQVRVRY